MGRCDFQKIIRLVLFFCLMGKFVPGYSYCFLVEKESIKNNAEALIHALTFCATQYNDDDSQIKLANNYLKGINGVDKNEMQALYMYQLAAETGNAVAQVELSQLLKSFDTSPERRTLLRSYQKKLNKVGDDPEAFSGQILHPYTLLLLAAERPENKWYYPSINRTAPQQVSDLLKTYQITSEKRQQAMKEASRWKTRKLLEAAKEVLSPEEYPDFEKRLKNTSTRTQAISQLKDRLMGYVDEKRKERALSL